MEHDGSGDWGTDDPSFGAGEDGSGLDGHFSDGADGPAEHEVVQDDAADDAANGPLDEHQFDEPGFDATDGPGLEFADLSDEPDDAGPEADDPSLDPDLDDPTAGADPVIGTDPDLDLVGDDPHWAQDDPFPPQLDVGETPEPVDGFPWSDPAVLGEQQDVAGPDDSVLTDPPPEDLADYDAQDLTPGTDPWRTLAGAEDPATSSLARWWGPAQ